MGWQGVEVLVALFNGALMLAVIIGIAYEAIQRLSAPQAVAGGQVMLIAFGGMLVNLLVAWILHKGEKSINQQAAMLHVLGDLLGVGGCTGRRCSGVLHRLVADRPNIILVHLRFAADVYRQSVARGAVGIDGGEFPGISKRARWHRR